MSVASPQERRACGLRIRIDRELCVGFGDCVEAAPSAFVLDGEGLAVFAAPEAATRQALIAACNACPVDALSAWDEEGRPLAPERRPKARR
ncbi:MAG TPA: ferredoxin [Vicinamibacteria bacterium]|nr:ferredoxin [Vicinamibacteria bacterium]